MRKQFWGILLALVSLLLVGCGSGRAQTFGGKPRPKAYATVVSLSPSTTEQLVGIGFPLAGRTKACDYPPNVKSVATYGDLKPDYEALARIKPDLLVFDGDLYSEAELGKLKALGADIVTHKADSVDEYIREMQILGAKLATETEFMSYIGRVNAARTTAGAAGARPRTVVIMPDRGGRHYVAGQKSFSADVVRSAGANVVGPDSRIWVELSPEWLVTTNPEFILIAGATKDFLADRRFESLNAVKRLRLAGVDQNIVVRRGYRVDSAITQVSKLMQVALANSK